MRNKKLLKPFIRRTIPPGVKHTANSSLKHEQMQLFNTDQRAKTSAGGNVFSPALTKLQLSQRGPVPLIYILQPKTVLPLVLYERLLYDQTKKPPNNLCLTSFKQNLKLYPELSKTPKFNTQTVPQSPRQLALL